MKLLAVILLLLLCKTNNNNNKNKTHTHTKDKVQFKQNDMMESAWFWECINWV